MSIGVKLKVFTRDFMGNVLSLSNRTRAFQNLKVFKLSATHAYSMVSSFEKILMFTQVCIFLYVYLN